MGLVVDLQPHKLILFTNIQMLGGKSHKTSQTNPVFRENKHGRLGRGTGDSLSRFNEKENQRKDIYNVYLYRLSQETIDRSIKFICHY